MEAGDHAPITPLGARPVSCYGTGPSPLRSPYGARLRAGIQVGGKESRLRESDDEWVTQMSPSVRAKTGDEAGRAWN